MAARRAALGASTAALHDRLSAEHLIADSTASLQRIGGQVLKGAGNVIHRNPAAAAMAIAGLVWLVLGRRRDGQTVATDFEAVSRWEDEGGTPHPDHDSVVEEIGPLSARRNGSALLGRIGRAVQDHPLPLGMIAAAIGGMLATRLPVTEVERAMVADAREQLRVQAIRLLDEGRARVETAASDLGDGLRKDLQSARRHVAEAVDQVSRLGD